MPENIDITDITEDRILAAINNHQVSHGHSPTHAEIAASCQVSESTVRRRVGRLIEDGRVESVPGTRRTLRVANMKGKGTPL